MSELSSASPEQLVAPNENSSSASSSPSPPDSRPGSRPDSRPEELISAIRPSRFYKIGELAEEAGTTTRTLRYYEELDLLEPVRNTAGQRVYDSTTLTRLHFIHELKAGGFSLAEIKQFFEGWQKSDSGAAASEATTPLIQQKLSEIADLQKKLAKLNQELMAMAHFLVSCRTCPSKPSVETCGDCDRHPDEPANSMIMRLVKTDHKN